MYNFSMANCLFLLIKVLFLTLLLPFTTFAQFSGGTGTLGDPYIITTAEQLNALRGQYLNSNFKLGNDIDLSEYGMNYDNGRGWTPIGTTAVGNQFTGVFDGDGKKITGLFIHRINGMYHGLFGYICETGVVINLGLEDVSVTDEGNTAIYTGGLSGQNRGMIENCYVKGTINGRNDVGLLVGDNFGGIILNSYATGTTNGADFVGGLAGRNNGGTIINCYAVVEVSGANNVGGLVGNNYINSSIENCYATGTVSGINYVGGLVGHNFNPNTSVITNCAALNSRVSGTGNVGRLAGNSASSATLNGNIAWNGMEITIGDNPKYPIGNALNHIDGLGKAAGDLREGGFFVNLFDDDDNWEYDDGKLPGLNGKTNNFPAYIDRIIYVKWNDSNGDGSSWRKAYAQLSDALLHAAKQNSAATNDDELITEIRVAEGAFSPEYSASDFNFITGSFPDLKTENDLNNSFVLVAGVKIYGGYDLDNPAEGAPPFGSPGRNGVTYLSGDLFGGFYSYHVIIGVDIPDDGETLIDGVSIKNGKALCCPEPDVFRTIFVNDKAIKSNSGGGIYNVNSSPVLRNVIITENDAYEGGGMYNVNSSPVLVNVFIGQSMTLQGGAMYNTELSEPELVNVTIGGNTAFIEGGGIYNDNSSPKIYNSIIWGNFLFSMSESSLSNNGSSAPDVQYSIVGGYSGGLNNIIGDPLLDDNYRLQHGSPAIDAGNNEL